MNVIDLLEEIGVQPKRVSSCKGGEYHSRCPDPQCDGKDRFCTWPKEGSDGRYWCRQCLRSGDAIQFCRDFMGMDFSSACAKVGRRATSSKKGMSIRHKPIFMSKPFLPPTEKWLQKASDFVIRSHQHLLNHLHLLDHDKNRGLTQKSIADFQLGWNPCDNFEQRQWWGLSDMTSERGGHSLCLPKGIVIPSFRDGVPIRIKIRRQSWNPEDKYPKYHIVAGGTNSPTVYGNISKPIILVEAELDAMLIQQFAADRCCCISLGGVSIGPDTIVDQILKKAPFILYALDFDEPGKKAFHFWKSTYSHVHPWPVPKGKSPGDAYDLGVNLQEWIDFGIKRIQYG